MRWNCPHCGVALAVADDKLGTGWSFSRCFKCGGFALVRRSDVNLIKVDQAPTGERVLLPESSEQPKLSQNALQNLTRTPRTAAHSVPAMNKSQAAPRSEPPQVEPPACSTNIKQPAVETRPIAIAPLSNSLPRLPDPLPDDPEASRSNRFLPVAIGIAGIMAIGSGIYLYVQGQTLWQKAREAAVDHSKMAPVRTVSAVVPSAQEAPQPMIKPAIVSDMLVDRLHQNAMAPSRAPSLIEEAASGGKIAQTLVIQPKVSRALLRSGPGTHYKLVGVADEHAKYVVKEWKDDWFKIELPLPPARIASAATIDTAWIRNDLVRSVDAAFQSGDSDLTP